MEPLESRTLLSAITVTTTKDVVADDGLTSLREAILAANDRSLDIDRINFAIGAGDPGYDAVTGVCTIQPLTQLPNITDAVVIDGYTQAGASANTLAVGSNAVLKVELRGDLLSFSGDAAFDANGLVLQGTVGSVVRGLAIGDFAGSGIQILVGSANRIEGNFIGTDATGATARGNGLSFYDSSTPYLANSFVAGVAIFSNDNVIGGTEAAARNVISDNLSGVAIRFAIGPDGQRNKIQGNLIGTDATGSLALGNRVYGVWSNAVDDTEIGGTASGAGNVVSANGYHGIEISGSRGVVQGNYVGTNAAGDAPLANGGDGIRAIYDTDTLIGGAGAGNLVYGGNGYGISSVNGEHTRVQGNIVGLDATGARDIDGGYQGGTGIFVQYAGALIGGVNPGEGNVVSGNNVGIDSRAAGTMVLGNFVGTDVTGKASIGNFWGVYLADGVTDCVIGAAGAGNLISGNSRGVYLNHVSGNRIQGNRIGTDVTGTISLGNTEVGAMLTGSGNLVGTGSDGVNDNAEGNLISGNGGDGILISGIDAAGNVVAGNRIGTNVTGTAAVRNANVGIRVALGAGGNRIGGAAAGAGNLISGNGSFGINLAGSSGNHVEGNKVGTNEAGTAAIANGNSGIAVNGANNVIGGTGAGAGNLLSGNSQHGVWLTGAGTSGNRIFGNRIGTNADGTAAIGNLQNGVSIQNAASGNFVGTNGDGIGDALEGNVISGNRNIGVLISGPGSDGNVVAGNLVGLAADGTGTLGNAVFGVSAYTGPTGTRIGTNGDGVSDVLERNVIAASGLDGIKIQTGANNSLVAGNFIGTDASGTSAKGNARFGVFIQGAKDNVVGGLGVYANLIALNGSSGVCIADDTPPSTPATGNTVRGNSIYSNGALGISIGPGQIADVNDPLDADTGPNYRQNYPIIAAVTSGVTTRVWGTLNSVPNATFTLDFYASAAADPSGYGEGQRWLGSAVATTDPGGNA
jgi:titin